MVACMLFGGPSCVGYLLVQVYTDPHKILEVLMSIAVMVMLRKKLEKIDH